MGDHDFDQWYREVASDERDHRYQHPSDRWYDIGGIRERTHADERALRQWCRALYEDAGPVTVDFLREAFGARQRVIVERAVAAVLRDVGPDTGMEFWIEIDERWAYGISLGFVSGRVQGGNNPLLAIDGNEAFVGAADAVQECVMEHLCSALPECPAHRSGLHARAHDGVPVWWCNVGAHAVAPIGALRS